MKCSKWLSAVAGVAVTLTMLPIWTSTAVADDISDASAQLLRQSALDARLGDDGKTPIAVADGDQVYGARASQVPYSADLQQIAGKSYFVDCSAAANGDGSQKSPFNSLDAANAVKLNAGDAMLFKGGAACTGTFTPQGSGTEAAPITIDAYDATADKRARIDADGAADAVHLYNVQHYVVRNLELTNTSGDAKDYASLRHGLRIELEDYGNGSGYEVANLYVHDVLGDNQKNSTGIRLEVNGDKTPTKFDGVNVHDNIVRHVNRTGLAVTTSWYHREEESSWPGGFYPMGSVWVHDNFLTDIGGDGIVVWNSPDAVIEYNTLENAANEHGGKTDNSHNAGIWSWVSDRTVFRNNHVFAMHRSSHNNDGAAFDADSGGSGLIFEHNLSHDNMGGFFMYCGCWGLSTRTLVRYNISLNDGRYVDMEPKCEAAGETARTIFTAGTTDSHFYNNTILLPPTEIDVAGFGHYMANNSVMANNLYIAQQGTVVTDTTTNEHKGSWANTLNWRNNVFAGPAAGAWPSGAHTADNQVVPGLTLAAGEGLARLHIQHDALTAAGYPIADANGEQGVTDFLGKPTPTVTNPDIGAFQYSAFPAQTTVADGGFEAADATAWKLDHAQVNAEGRRSGASGLYLDKGGSATQTVKAAIDRTYRLTAAVHTDGNGELPSISVTLPSKAVAHAEPMTDKDGKPIVSADGWTPVSVVFRTSYDASTFDLAVDAKDGGWADDIVAEGVYDHIVDGSFEAPANTVWQPPVDIIGTPGNAGESGPLERSTDAVTGALATPVPVTGKRQTATGTETFTADAFNRFVYVTPGQNYELGVWAKADAGKEVTLAWRLYPGFSQGYPLTNITPLGAASTKSTEYTRVTVPVNSTQNQIEVRCSGNGLCDDMTLVSAWNGTAPAIGDASPNQPSKPKPSKPKPTEPTSPTESTEPAGKDDGANPVVKPTTGDGSAAKDKRDGAAAQADKEEQSAIDLAHTGATIFGVCLLAGALMLIGVVVASYAHRRKAEPKHNH